MNRSGLAVRCGALAVARRPSYNGSFPRRTRVREGSRALADRYFQHTFPSGLTLLAEQMPGMQSAAMTLLVPAGSSTDPVDRTGAATVLSDLVLRGAGERDSRQLTEHLDSLGLQRSNSVGVHHSRFGCAALAAKVLQGL